MKNHSFKYGSSKTGIILAGKEKRLNVKEPVFGISRKEFSTSLSNLLPVKPGNSVGIIVSDKTRLCGYDTYLPWLTEYLCSREISKDDIVFYIAYGTHPVQSDEESYKAYGETYNNFSFIHHDCNDEDALQLIGTTSRGTEVRIRKDIYNHDHLVLFGAISHHYFAGYGGGRKLIFPGLAARESIYQNHKLFIDFEAGRLDPGCQSGQMDGNPVAEDLKEIDRLLPDKLIISGILDTSGKLAVIEFNSSYEEFEKSCAAYDKSYRCTSREQYDLVLASAGGYPKDINFIQTHKSLHNAATFVKDGGTLILLGECRDGIGNNIFLDIFSGSINDIVRDLEKNYSGNGGTALSTLTKTSRIKTFMQTELSEDQCNKMGIEKIDTTRAQEIINSTKGSMAYIENASIIF